MIFIFDKIIILIIYTLEARIEIAKIHYFSLEDKYILIT